MDISKLRKKARGTKKTAETPVEAVVEEQQALPVVEEIPAVSSDQDWDTDEDAFGEPSPASVPAAPVMGGLLGQLVGETDTGDNSSDATADGSPSEDFEPDSDDDLEAFDSTNRDYDDDDDDEDLYEGYDADLERLGLLAQIGQSAVGSDLVEYLFFQAKSEPYALRIGRVKEIIKPRALTVVPRSPDYMQGILALRGEMIPVVDLGACLGLRESADGLAVGEQPRIVVLAKGENKLGLVVDKIQGVIRMDENLFEDPSAVQGARDNRYVQAIGKNMDGFVIVLDVDEFFVQGET